MLVPVQETGLIEYGWQAAAPGWRFVVRIPAETGLDDRIRVLTWLAGYARDVRRQRPNWVVTLHSAPDGYFLEGMETRTAGEFIQFSLSRLASNAYAPA